MSKTVNPSPQFSPMYAHDDAREIAAMFSFHTGRGFGRHVRGHFAAPPVSAEPLLQKNFTGPLTLPLRSVLPDNI